MKNIFFFDSLITPKILVVIYWLCLLSVLISSVTTMYVGSFLLGLLALIFGCLGTRVCFELVMIAFKNNEYLRLIAERSNTVKATEE